MQRRARFLAHPAGERIMLSQFFRSIWVLSATCVVSSTAWSAPPKNVILLIGDGMGFEQVKAAGMYQFGTAGTLSFEGLPYTGEVVTTPAGGGVTDSAAAATAMATGYKVNNGVISLMIPGDGSELLTALEYFKGLGYRTGLVTTTYLTHATPAGFGAHETSRNNTSQIAGDYLNQTRPDLLFGGGANGLSTTAAASAGYAVVTTCSGLQGIDPDTATKVSAQFGTYHLPYEFDGYGTECHLSEMTSWALDMLEEDTDGFFLMVEGGRIDHAGHDNDLPRNVFETVEFHNTVQVVIDWAAGRTDTLIAVTADHETGGLTVLQNNGQFNFPTVSWSTGGHTGVNVPIYAWGMNADMVSGVMDNTKIFDLVTVSPEITRSPSSFTHTIDLGTSPPDDSFTLENTGIGTLSYTISDNVDWLDVDTPSGTSSGEPDTITITYSTAGLGGGTHNGLITISDPFARNTPQTIAVTITVIGPTIEVIPAAIDRTVVYSDALPNDTFSVRNAGGLTLYYTISETSDWLSVSPTEGDSTDESDAIDILYDLTGLAVGEHAALISVESDDAGNSPQIVTVTVTIEPIPGDMDHDGDVDQTDFGRLQACLSGPGTVQNEPACADARLDTDGDVDQYDVEIFLGCQSGADVPADPHCAD
jgi:alkaline phosphatase